MSAALPWICIGLLLAIFFAQSERKKKENKKCRSLFKSTLNTRVLPTGNLRYIRSDFPDRLTDDEVKWLIKNDIIFIIDLREEKEYQKKHCRFAEETRI